MTTQKFYSLSEQSVDVADQVMEDVHVRAFYPGGDHPDVRDLLELYQNRNGRITWEFIDPDKAPLVAQQYAVTVYGDLSNPLTGESVRYGTLILEMGGRTERIEKQSQPLVEEDVTNALLKIIKGERKTIYFVEGHGERSVDDSERTGFSLVRGGLERENYVVNKINLVQEDRIPEDASIVVVAGPASELFANELDLIDAYLNNGGSALILLDPAPAASLKSLMTKWSVNVGDNVVLDATGMGRLLGMGPAAPLVASYGPHQITERMRSMTFYPMSRSVSAAATPVAGLTVETLVETSTNSWGETNMEGAEAVLDENTDLKGPVPLGLAVSKSEGEAARGRLVVYGDSDFASNAYYSQAGNGNIFMNTINWLAHDENFITIRPKSQDDRPLTMTEGQSRLVSYIAVLLLPVSVLVAGVSVWMKRRK
jgi:ABC-type uncharacterized transport system involved in gliding motility auxiliary subunit